MHQKGMVDGYCMHYRVLKGGKGRSRYITPYEEAYIPNRFVNSDNAFIDT